MVKLSKPRPRLQHCELMTKVTYIWDIGILEYLNSLNLGHFLMSPTKYQAREIQILYGTKNKSVDLHFEVGYEEDKILPHSDSNLKQNLLIN